MKQKIKNYFKYWQNLSQLKFNLAMRLSLIVVITAFIVSGFIIYFSAKQLIQEKNNFINNELIAINTELKETFSSYTTMLGLIEAQIQQNKNIFSDSSTSTKEVMQIYLQLNNKNDKTKINFKDIIWQNTLENFVVNKYGNVETLEFQSNIVEYLKKDPKNIYLDQEIKNDLSFKVGDFYLLKGIWTNDNQYLGQLMLNLDFLSWWQSLTDKLNKTGYTLLMTDNQQKILLSTFSQEREIMKNNEIFPTSVVSSLFITPPVKYKKHLFSQAIQLEVQPYFLLLGYDEVVYRRELLAKIRLPLAICWGAAFFFIVIQILYYRRIRAEINFSLKDDMNQLIKQNQICNQEQQKIVLSMTQQEERFIQEKNKYEVLIAACETSIREKDKLEKRLLDNLFTKLTEVRENLWILIKAQEVQISNDPKSKKQAIILTELHEQLAHLTEFSIFDEKERLVDLNSLIEECLNIFAKELSQLETYVDVTKFSHKNIICNELLLREIVVNLLRESIYFSRDKGVLEIIPNLQKNEGKTELCIVIKDNGYGISSEQKQDNKENNKHGIVPLDLDIKRLTKMVEFLGGQLLLSYAVDQGKTMKLILPLKQIED